MSAPVSAGSGPGAGDHGHDAVARRLLYRGTLVALLVQVGGAGLGLLVHAILARLLGATSYGAYTLALTWVNVLAVAATLGQTVGVVRFVPGYVHHAMHAELRGLRRRVSLLVFAASAGLSLAGAGVVFLLRAHLGQELELTLFAGLALLPVLTQLQLSGALHRGLKRAASSGAFNNLLRPALLLGFVLVLVTILHRHMTAPLAMLASCLGALAALGCSEWFLVRAWPKEARRARPRYQTRAWLRVGKQLLLVDAIGIVLNRVDVLILGGLSGATEVGPYYAAVQLAAIAVYGTNAVETMLAPMVVERYVASDDVGLLRLVHQAARLIFAATFAALLAAVLLGKWTLGLFGPGFEVAYVPLLVILAGQCIHATVGPVGYLLTMTRFEREASLIFGGGALVNLLLSAFLIPSFGMLGAAVATASSTVAWKVAALFVVRVKLGINPTIVRLRYR